jgi:hypothetical protein
MPGEVDGRVEFPVISNSGEVKVALASLVKMINLLGAELLVGKYREDVDIFEACVRAKLFAHVEGVSPESTAGGVALAHSLIEPVLKQLRERVRSLQVAESAAAAEQAALPHRLN